MQNVMNAIQASLSNRYDRVMVEDDNVINESTGVDYPEVCVLDVDGVRTTYIINGYVTNGGYTIRGIEKQLTPTNM